MENFSVNVPSSGQVSETDYGGLVSGRKFDKSCVFKSFFGTVDKAPMIEECPVNLLLGHRQPRGYGVERGYGPDEKVR